MKLLKKLTVVFMLVLLCTFAIGIVQQANAGEGEKLPIFSHHCSGNVPVGNSAALVWFLLCVAIVY